MARIEQRGESWRVQWRLCDGKGALRRDAAGKALVQSATWPSRDLATQAKDIAEAHRHQWTADQVYDAILEPSGGHRSKAPTLTEWFADFIESKTRITRGTEAGYRQQFRDHIEPALGAKPLDRITAVDVGKWINRRREAGVKNSTLTREFALLHQTLEAAVRARHIERNPCKETDFVRDRVDDTDTGEGREKYLTWREYELVRARFAPEWHPLLDFFAETGTRWSEATALQTGDIVHPTARSLRAKVKISRAWKRSGKGDDRYLGPTKGRRRREVSIRQALYDTLVHLAPPKKNALVFHDGDGGTIHYSNFWNRVWKPALIEAQRCPEHPPPRREEQREGATGRCGDFGGRTKTGGPCGARVPAGYTRCTGHMGPEPNAVSTCDCPDVVRLDGEVYGPHLLRHSFASWLFLKGVPQLTISRVLGHSTTMVTSEVYGHLMPESDDAVLDALQRIEDDLNED
ncbi:site-specific integrase [Micromonospora sp. NPDC023814]|uniref:tyrosine-type recombinase/integrase n=1 Tax=Micromonospora sp. NPDC023814 TaxID=3154596 RepID=UPI0033FDC63B